VDQIMCNLRKSGLVPQLESRKSRPHSVFSFLKRRRRRRRRKMKIISFGLLAQVGPFSILGPTYRLSVFTTGYHQLPSLAFRTCCHLLLANLFSPPATSVSLHHQPPFFIFELKLPEFSTLSLGGKYILNIILLIYIS